MTMQERKWADREMTLCDDYRYHRITKKEYQDGIFQIFCEKHPDFIKRHPELLEETVG